MPGAIKIHHHQICCRVRVDEETFHRIDYVITLLMVQEEKSHRSSSGVNDCLKASDIWVQMIPGDQNLKVDG